MSKRIIRSKSDKETQRLAQKLGRRQASSLICLYGDLGAGKTTFVKGLAVGLGILSRITSPTFTYQHVYKVPRLRNFASASAVVSDSVFGPVSDSISGKKQHPLKLYHFDCYRFKAAGSKNPFLVNDMMEALERNDGIVVIEWAEHVEKFLPAERIDVKFEYVGESERKISIENYKL